MKLEKAIKIIKDIDVLDDTELQEAYDTVFQEIEHLQKKYDTDTHILQNKLDIANAEKIELQKENEELRIDRDNYKGCFVVAMENSISKDKIRELKEKLSTESANVYNEFLDTNRTDNRLHTKGLMLDGGIQILENLLNEEN